MAIVQLTPTERRIHDTLCDMRGHSVDDLMLCLNDDMAEVNTVRVHICRIRKKLPPGFDIIYSQRTESYCMVRMVGSAND